MTGDQCGNSNITPSNPTLTWVLPGGPHSKPQIHLCAVRTTVSLDLSVSNCLRPDSAIKSYGAGESAPSQPKRQPQREAGSSAPIFCQIWLAPLPPLHWVSTAGVHRRALWVIQSPLRTRRRASVTSIPSRGKGALLSLKRKAHGFVSSVVCS